MLSENSILYCSEGSPDTFNPQLTISSLSLDATSKQFYNTLITSENNGRTLLPSLAKSWHVTNDGLIYTFYLRQNVHFHQTAYFTPSRFMNADDVVFSFNRILDKQHAFHQVSGGDYPFFEKNNFSTIVKRVEKINDFTVRFKLRHANNSLLPLLSSGFAVILSQEYAQQLLTENKLAQIDSLPIGTGPFKLKEYRVGSFIRYTPHRVYWGETSTIEQLVFDITPSNTGRLTKLLAGECDAASNPIAHRTILSRKDLHLSSVTGLNVTYLALNTQKPPLDHIDVRKAIESAINKAAIIETVFFNKAAIAHTIVPDNSWAYPSELNVESFSTIKAIEKLVATGYADGFALKMLIKTNQYVDTNNALTITEMVKNNLDALSISLDIVVEKSDLYESLSLKEQDYDIVLNTWYSEHEDPSSFFMPLLSCKGIKQGSNLSQWCNKQYDQIITKALTVETFSDRVANYQQALALLDKEMPLIPISHDKDYLAQSTKVKGNLLSPQGGISFNLVSKQ